MFSHVDGWAEQGGHCWNCGNPLQKPVERASGVPSSGGAC
jgi:hypothetical protein